MLLLILLRWLRNVLLVEVKLILVNMWKGSSLKVEQLELYLRYCLENWISFVWREPFSFTFYQGFLNNFRDISFWKYIQTLHVRTMKSVGFGVALQDLKKSGSGRCVILGTVTATVNGAELGGMIPPLAHVGALNRDEKLWVLEMFNQSLDGWRSFFRWHLWEGSSVAGFEGDFFLPW